MEILSHIHGSADVQKLTVEELDLLCAELREAITDATAKNGGHLASNLGAVELTVALHRVYDSEKDRLVFDVGHQCYAHKMLTGRLAEFDTLRRYGGLSGFPDPAESNSDACVAGHASTSISQALGMARARTILGADYDVAAVIGDGALTGGLAYEGLSDCGESGESILVILNDNGMSINSNVGGMARLLSRQRVKPSYIKLKKVYHRTIGRCLPLYGVLHRFKEWVKDLVLPDNMFEDMGFYYLGPIDGHDMKTLVRTIRYAREMHRPVLLHVTTVKGKGYAPAQSQPGLYHGVPPFDRATGVQPGAEDSFSTVFGQELTRLAQTDGRITAVTAAMADGTGLTPFAQRFPARFFDVGIAEAHAAVMCAGMAARGLKPVFAVYSSFLQRAFDMLIHDVGLPRLPVVFAVDRAGLVGADGRTHQGVFDVGFLRQTPGMAIYAPASFAELRGMLSLALAETGPCALRYPRGGEGDYRADLSQRRESALRSGTDVCVVSYGILINQALAAAEALQNHGISATVIKLGRLDGDDFPLTLAAAEKTGRLVVAEDCAAHGGMGQALAACLEEACAGRVRCRLLNLGDGVVPHGDVKKLMEVNGIDAAAIAAACRDLCEDQA